MENKTTFTVKVSDNYCEWQYGIQVDKKRCIDDLVQCIESGLKARRVYQKLINDFNSIKNNMDNFKLDLTQLTPVEEKYRIKGNYYVACDKFGIDIPIILRFHSDSHNMNAHGEKSASWKNWFLIPPGLPGFPVAELPDEIEINAGDWEKQFPSGWRPLQESHKLRRINKLPTLTIPSGTRAEQLAKLKELLAAFETF